MQGFAGILVIRDSQALLVNEPDFFTGEARWTFPSGHMEHGEDPVTAAVRELAEEAGYVVDALNLHLVAVADVEQDGEVLSRSWNYTTSVTSSFLGLPRDIEEETVTEAGWFDKSEAVLLLRQSTFAPKVEPACRFLVTGDVNLHWRFDLTESDVSTKSAPSFRWSEPAHHSNLSRVLQESDKLET